MFSQYFFIHSFSTSISLFIHFQPVFLYSFIFSQYFYIHSFSSSISLIIHFQPVFLYSFIYSQYFFIHSFSVSISLFIHFHLVFLYSLIYYCIFNPVILLLNSFILRLLTRGARTQLPGYVYQTKYAIKTAYLYRILLRDYGLFIQNKHLICSTLSEYKCMGRFCILNFTSFSSRLYIMQEKLIAVAYTLSTYSNQFSLGGICKQEQMHDQNISLIFYVKDGSHIRLRHPSCVYITAQRPYTAVQKMRTSLK